MVATHHRRTVVYIRVSTLEQAEEGYSLADQERACRLYAQAQVAVSPDTWSEVSEVYADPGVSGTIRDRPGLNRLLRDARAGTIGRVVCTKLDRMGRRAADILAIEDELEGYGVERSYIKDAIDTSTATGRLLRTVLAAVAELERENILERTAAGAKERARRGEVTRPRHIYGYTYIPGNKAEKRPAELVVNEDQRRIVERIFTELAQGSTANQVAQRLTDDGVPTMRGAKVWWNTTIRQIVHNPAYVGKPTHGRLKTVHVKINGRPALTRGGKPKRRYQKASPKNVIYGACPRIVGDELAKAAQDQLARNTTISQDRASDAYMLNGGLLRCGLCDAEGYTRPHTLHGYSTNRNQRRYRCHHMKTEGDKKGRIGYHSFGADLVEATLWDAVRAMLLDPSHVLAELDALSDASSAEARRLTTELEAAEHALSEVQGKQSRLLDLYLNEKLAGDAYDAKAAELTAQQDQLRARVADLTAQRGRAAVSRIPTDDVKAACAHLSRGLDAMTYDERRALMQALCTRATVTRETMTIEAVLPAGAGATADDAGVIVYDGDTTPSRSSWCITTPAATPRPRPRTWRSRARWWPRASCSTSTCSTTW